MKKIKSIISNLTNFQKVTYAIVLLLVILFISIGIPTLARYNNKTIIDNTPTWDTTIATSYNSGTGIESDPYVISNSQEFLYFTQQLLNNNYENTYFTLSNNLVINRGTFNYDVSSGLTYILDNNTYYVDIDTNKYYDNVEKVGNEIGTLNIISPLSNFKGIFNGNSNVMYGAYIKSNTNDNVSLFSSLEGTVKNLYLENIFSYGGSYTSAIAAKTDNAIINNVSVSGFVVGKNTLENINVENSISDKLILLSNTESTDYINLTSNIPLVGNEIISTSITGTYQVEETGNNIIKINGNVVSGGTFNIDLGTSILNSIPIVTSTDSSEAVNLSITNIKYNITYKYGVSGGLVAFAKNTTISNAVNKANVYGSTSSGGIIGTSVTSTNIANSYNIGNISSNYASGGLIGVIEENTLTSSINKCYNTASITATNIGGLVGIINNNSDISISNTFNTSTTNYDIGTITNTNVIITNSYNANHVESINNGILTGSFSTTTVANLQNKEYMTGTLLFNEFVDSTDVLTNQNNVWIYENNNYPKIYIDREMLPAIHVSTYSWDSYKENLNTIELNSNITFSIEDSLGLSQYLKKYYYISSNTSLLTKTELNNINTWTTYSDITQITTDGSYIIYVKIVDYDGKTYYINTDILKIDSTSPNATISFNDTSYTNLRDSLENVYTGTIPNLIITASDNLSGVASVKYYIGNSILDKNALDALTNESWITYENPITLTVFGMYVVYAKVTDNFNNVTYVNTNYIIYNGYRMNDIIIGRDSASYNEITSYITHKSTITLNYSYSFNENALSDYTHNLVSNILLPLGTKISLIDHINNKTYVYQISTSDDIYGYSDSCAEASCKRATYPFTLFKEIGKSNVSNFIENTYSTNGVSSEEFSVILDFTSTTITTNYTNILMYLEVHNSSNLSIRPTLTSTLKTFNIYSKINNESSNASLFINTDYSGNAINLNSNSNTSVNLNSGLLYKNINGNNVIDTSFENKKIGLALTMVDEDGNTINKGHLKNLQFNIGNNFYSMESDNFVHINLNNGINNTSSELVITTFLDNITLKSGIYYLKIYSYASYDGYYFDELSNQVISIPVNVVNNKVESYGFDVIMDDNSRVINKSVDSTITFNILQKGYLANPSIRVSLYEKEKLTAYDQNYILVDLSNYVTNTLLKSSDNNYIVTNSPIVYNGTSNSYNNFELNLIPNNFLNTGYKFVFDLYDGVKKVETIEKTIIVK